MFQNHSNKNKVCTIWHSILILLSISTLTDICLPAVFAYTIYTPLAYRDIASSNTLFTSPPILHIPYGSENQDIFSTHSLHVIFTKGPSQSTTVNNIDLQGPISILELTSAQVHGFISIGDISSEESIFIGSEAYIEQGITMNGINTYFEANEGLVINAPISILGSNINIVSIDKTSITYDISIGTTSSSNMIMFSNVMIHNADIYIDGITSKLILSGNIFISPQCTISIWGNSYIVIDSPLSSLSFINLEPDKTHTLVLGAGYKNTSQGNLELPLPDKVGNTLILDGANISSDIILGQHVDIDIIWSSGTTLNGGIYRDFNKTQLEGIGLVHTMISSSAVPSRLPDGFILGLQEKSLWNGNIIGNTLELGIVNSTVTGDINASMSSIFIKNSTIQGNINAQGSTIVLNNIFMEGEEISVQEAYVQDTIHYHNSTPRNYYFHSNILHLHNMLSPVFSTYNSVLGDNIHVSNTLFSSSSNEILLFEGDVDFNTLKADTIILTNTTHTGTYIVNYTMHNTSIFTDIRKIENVLQGFTTTPLLLRNTMSGYDVSLQPNALIPNNYDLVLLGYSNTNDAFAGAFFSQHMHTSALEDTTRRQFLQSVDVLTNKEKQTQGASLWTDFSFYHSTRTQHNYSKLRTSLFSWILGASSAPLTLNETVNTIFDAFLNIAHSRSTIYDIEDNSSKAYTTSISGRVMSTWNLTIQPSHFWFLSIAIGGTSFNTTISRPYSKTNDEWNCYTIGSSFYTGYSGRIGGFSITPYAGLGYTYTSGINITSDDGTHIERMRSHDLSPLIGIQFDYRFQGIRPYFNTTCIFPLPLTKSSLKVQDVIREYEQYTPYANFSLGIEYTHILQYTSITFHGEVGLQATMHKQSQLTPNLTLSIAFTF